MSSSQVSPSQVTAPVRAPVRRGVLIRYQIMAYLTAVFLLLLVFVAIPIQIWGHDKTMEAIVGQIHGFLYMVYLVIAFDLSMRARWPLRYTALILLAGTVPFLSFVAERSVTRRVRAAGAAQSEPVRSSAA